jgi:hypothetical protein
VVNKSPKVTNDVFWPVFMRWWAEAGGTNDELKQIQRLAADKKQHPARMLLVIVRRALTIGDF